MFVIPAINETSFEEIKKKILLAESFDTGSAAGGASWVHLDVADGKFTPNLLWNEPKDLANLQLTCLPAGMATDNLQSKIEVHLMAEEPEEVIEEWLKTGIKRIFVHYEAVGDVMALKNKCSSAGVELGLAVGPHIPVEGLFGYKNKIFTYLILAVEPGTAGQKFLANQLEKIKLLRQGIFNAKIEVDGGINLKNAFDIKQAGADILVSASYIWNSKNPKEAFELLKSV